jgi:hypothetical protein
MSFAFRSTEELIRIVNAGGGLVLDAATRSTEDLIRIAHAGSTKGVRLVLVGLATKSTEDLIRIANAGNGCVQFAP